eukprot:SAG11_NODE_3117_length_2674_cov_2.246214_2_plen_227_part_00
MGPATIVGEAVSLGISAVARALRAHAVRARFMRGLPPSVQSTTRQCHRSSTQNFGAISVADLPSGRLAALCDHPGRIPSKLSVHSDEGGAHAVVENYCVRESEEAVVQHAQPKLQGSEYICIRSCTCWSWGANLLGRALLTDVRHSTYVLSRNERRPRCRLYRRIVSVLPRLVPIIYKYLPKWSAASAMERDYYVGPSSTTGFSIEKPVVVPSTIGLVGMSTSSEY